MSRHKKISAMLCLVQASYPNLSFNSVKYDQGMLYCYSPDYMNGDMSTGKLFRFRMDWRAGNIIEC